MDGIIPTTIATTGTTPRPPGGSLNEASPAVLDFGRAAAGDLRWLARLHDREPTAELLEGLRAQPLQDLFGLTLDRDDARQAMALIDEELGDLPRPIGEAALDDLAADFAAIHLTNALRASPMESVWVHEEPLRRQEAMFRVKAWHRRFGLVSDDPRDPDHLVLELHFLADLLESGHGLDATAFLDQHPLRWIPRFCGRVAARCRTPYFAGVALLTGAYLDHLRQLLGAAFDLPRPADGTVPEAKRKGACG